MWRSSHGKELMFLTKSQYHALDFELECSVKNNVHNSSGMEFSPKCVPFHQNTVSHLTPSDLLFDIITSGKDESGQDLSFEKVSNLLSSMAMNGLPLLGLDDFVFLSDFVNINIDDKEKQQLLSYPASKDRFSNFISAREKEIRLAPNSCWTSEFLRQLHNSSSVAKV